MNILTYLYTRIMVVHDEQFLIKQGMRKAKKRGLELNLATQEILTSGKDIGRIYLPPVNHSIDAKQLIALVADDYPERTMRYLQNKRKLED